MNKLLYLVIFSILLSLSASAEIEFNDSSNIQFRTGLEMNSNSIVGLPSATVNSEPLTLGQAGSDFFNRSGDSLSGDLDMSGYDIKNAREIRSVPSAPSSVTSIDTSAAGSSFDVIVRGDIAYLTQYDANTMTSFDISDPNNPVELSEVSITRPLPMQEMGGYILVGSQGSGEEIKVISVSNPSNMNEVGSISLSNTPIKFEMSGRYGFIPSGSELKIIDFTDPSNPREVSSFSDSSFGYTSDIEIRGSTAYVTNRNSNNLVALDISDPKSVTKLDAFTSSNMDDIFALDIDDSTAYIASRDSNDLTLVDISNPSSMTQRSSISVPSPIDLHVIQETAYVSTDGGSFYAIDVSDVSNPSEIYEYTGFSTNWNFFVNGRQAYIPDKNDQLTVLDLAGLDAPSARIGSLESDQITSNGDIKAKTVNVRNGLQIGSQGIQSEGDSSFGGNVEIKGGKTEMRDTSANPVLDYRFQESDDYGAFMRYNSEFGGDTNDNRLVMGTENSGNEYEALTADRDDDWVRAHRDLEVVDGNEIILDDSPDPTLNFRAQESDNTGVFFRYQSKY
ncbi:MAG: hypothetical protein V5A72_02765, partial [Candidatus Nanohaloarchaea archaeon]